MEFNIIFGIITASLGWITSLIVRYYEHKKDKDKDKDKLISIIKDKYTYENKIFYHRRNVIEKYLKYIFTDSKEIKEIYEASRRINIELDKLHKLNNMLKRENEEVTLTKAQTITLELLNKKAIDSEKAYIYGVITLGITMLLYFVGYMIKFTMINPNTILFIGIYLLLCHLRQWVFEYRIKNGFYGTCYAEAKELVHYIVNNNKKDSGEKGTPIFLDEEVEAKTSAILGRTRHA